jgi:hypothetical protein
MRIYRKLLCLVLVALLMTSSVFAMTVETEEAKKAIVETRVKKELLTGQVTSSEDVIRVALEHCDAPIAKDGMTACIDEDGRIQVTQVLNETAVKNGFAMRELAVTQLVVVNASGVEVKDTPLKDSGGLNKYSVFATQTGYYSVSLSTMAKELLIKVKSMSTTLTYGTSMTASKLVQEYIVSENGASGLVKQSSTVNSPIAGKAYYFTPNAAWYNPVTGNPSDFIGTHAKIYVGSDNFELKTALPFNDDFNHWS